MEKGVFLFRSDDVNNVFVQPLLVLRVELAFEVLVLFLLLFCSFFDVLLLVLVLLLRSLSIGNSAEGECSRQKSKQKPFRGGTVDDHNMPRLRENLNPPEGSGQL